MEITEDDIGRKQIEACHEIASSITDIACDMAAFMDELANSERVPEGSALHERFVDEVLPPFAAAEDFFNQLARELTRRIRPV